MILLPHVKLIAGCQPVSLPAWKMTIVLSRFYLWFSAWWSQVVKVLKVNCEYGEELVLTSLIASSPVLSGVSPWWCPHCRTRRSHWTSADFISPFMHGCYPGETVLLSIGLLEAWPDWNCLCLPPSSLCEQMETAAAKHTTPPSLQ